jgi:hypothetical protein
LKGDLEMNIKLNLIKNAIIVKKIMGLLLIVLIKIVIIGLI